MLIQHHIKYKELHGVDEIALIDAREHRRIHNQLLKEGGCSIPPRISKRAHLRTPKYKLTKKRYESTERGHEKKLINSRKYNKKAQQNVFFKDTIGVNLRLHEKVSLNIQTGVVSYSSWFEGNHLSLPQIDEVKA